ncbi:unnamed protein product [Protopolystoma xenopodis]|uniref:Uncharacterized protein n=1 Tax=Protopolystoma xenopodis TaxID=117903 RepID=A0A3S5B8I5_9PLAT|nr:unnamed protein product [Protopolystoma xenopodis]
MKMSQRDVRRAPGQREQWASKKQRERERVNLFVGCTSWPGVGQMSEPTWARSTTAQTSVHRCVPASSSSPHSAWLNRSPMYKKH